jgi:parvulin-like peptidyl-prolyl isomerase
MAPDVALIVELPWATPLARPDALIDAIEALEDAQLTEPVRSVVEPSE